MFGGARLYSRRKQVIEFALRRRLPTLFFDIGNVIDGGLMSFTPNQDEHVRATARYVDRILKGAKPGDLPVERPTKLELVINLKTAKAIGIAIPQSLLLRADRVIE